MRLFFSSIFLCLLSTLAIASSSEDKTQILKDMGMENIRIIEDEQTSYIALEDIIYRSNADGVLKITEAIREIDSTKNIELLLLNDGVAQIAVSIDKDGNPQKVSYDTKEITNKLKGEKAQNKSFGKVDLVIYPEVFLENSWLDKLYGFSFSLSPALEVGLWHGAKVTAQVVLPLYTNLNDQTQYIRAGVISFSQRFRVYKQLEGLFEIGNFKNDRIGVNLKLGYHTANGRWGFGAEGGYTGSSTIYGGEWIISVWQRATWGFWASYYEPHFKLRLKAELVKKVYGDTGIEASVSRYFGHTLMGAWLCRTDGVVNGGFHFTIPLPYNKRFKRNKGFRVTYPEYFSRTYKARSGKLTLTGFDYETSPHESTLKDDFNPIYIKNELLKQKD